MCVMLTGCEYSSTDHVVNELACVNTLVESRPTLIIPLGKCMKPRSKDDWTANKSQVVIVPPKSDLIDWQSSEAPTAHAPAVSSL